MFEIDREELMRVYAAEAEESLAVIEEMLVVLESRPGDAETLHAIFRAAHTLKGNSASVGFDAPAKLAHAMEDLLDEVRENRFPVTPALVTLLLGAGDGLRRTIEASMSGDDALSSAAARLIDALARAKNEGVAPELEQSDEETQDVRASAKRRLRVDLDRLDAILNLTGELTIAKFGTLQA